MFENYYIRTLGSYQSPLQLMYISQRIDACPHRGTVKSYSDSFPTSTWYEFISIIYFFLMFLTIIILSTMNNVFRNLHSVTVGSECNIEMFSWKIPQSQLRNGSVVWQISLFYWFCQNALFRFVIPVNNLTSCYLQRRWDRDLVPQQPISLCTLVIGMFCWPWPLLAQLSLIEENS